MKNAHISGSNPCSPAMRSDIRPPLDGGATGRTEHDEGRPSQRKSAHPLRSALKKLSCFTGQNPAAKPSTRRATLPSQNPHDAARARAISQLPTVGMAASTQPRPRAQHQSLDAIAQKHGVAPSELENHIKKEAAAFCERMADDKSYSAAHEPFIDSLYNLFVLSQHAPPPAAWLEHVKSFDAFAEHFCPQGNKNAQAALIYHVDTFARDHLPTMLLDDFLERIHSHQHSYNTPGNWVKLPQAWADIRVIEEVRQLGHNGIPNQQETFVHGTGSAALAGIAKHQAISSAKLALSRGDKIATGERVGTLGVSGNDAICTGGLGDVYVSKAGLGSDAYTTRRWFDEYPVTFGISEKKQRSYNTAQGIDKNYASTHEGIVVGSQVPLENIVAISAPKANEAQVRSWIAAHCPHAQFVSYEAAEILERKDLFGLIPEQN